MIYFENSRKVNLNDLSKVVDQDGKRVYSENLLQRIEYGDLNALNEISISDRNNRYFMEPLLYAVKNSQLSTYEVFKYYGESLQKSDLTIATEIVINEPDVFEYTAIADDPTSVLRLAQINSKIILYMSEDLKSNGNFIEELCETGNKEAIMYAARECNISDVLQDNPDLANNPEFIKEACKANTELIEYITEHTEDFSSESLKAAKGVLVENTRNSAISGFEKELEELQEKKLTGNTEEVQRREEQVKRHIKSFEKEEDISPRKARFMLKLCKDLDEEHRKKLEQIVKLDEAVIAKQKEEKDKKVSPQDIEKLSENSKLSEIQAEPTAIREQITSEREQTTKENQEIGEM